MSARSIRPALCLLVAVASAVPAAAQTQVTAYGGGRTGSGFQQASGDLAPIDLRSGGAVSIGIERPYDASRQWQLLLSHQRTELDLGPGAAPGAQVLPLNLTYVHLGGLNFFDGQAGRGPYVSGGLGVTYLSPRLQGTSSRVRGSMSVGLGYQWPLGSALAVRTELRGYVTLIRSDGSFFCSGGCVVSIKGETLTQVEAMVGLTVGF